MDDPEDKEIIVKVKNGEINYYTLLVRKYSEKFYNYAKQRINNPHDAADVIQNSFIKMYKNIDHFDEARPFSPYFYSIVNNEIAQFYRNNPKLERLNESMEAQSSSLDENYTGENILVSLKENYKETLRLYIEGFSYKEISVKLGKPINTIRTYIRRAKEQLRNEGR